MAAKKNSALSVRIPDTIKRDLVREARADQRSLASLILKILTERKQAQAEAAE